MLHKLKGMASFATREILKGMTLGRNRVAHLVETKDFPAFYVDPALPQLSLEYMW